MSFFSKAKIIVAPQLALSFVMAMAICLSVSHRWFNFWGLKWQIQGLILIIVVPIISIFLQWMFSRISDERLLIGRKRWVVFFVPAILVAFVLARQLYLSPKVWHSIEVIPSRGGEGEIQLIEIKIPPGAVVSFSKVKKLDGWIIEKDILRTDSVSPGKLEYSFWGSVSESVSIMFLASPVSRDVTVVLDGKSKDINLHAPLPEEKVFLMTTEYKRGISGNTIVWIVRIADFITFLTALTLTWLIQEIPQTHARVKKKDEAFLSHKNSLIILLSFSFIIHLINFLAVPFILGSDSMSYLDGAIHWVKYFNLDGFSSSRGPVTTFLLLPGMLISGQNPWGVKITLHLMMIACVPLAYGLGWQLGKQRWIAFSTGLIAALTPDLFVYSNTIMSEGPNIFFGLIHLLLLLIALQKMSWRWIVSAMLAGSISILLRPENALQMGLGIIFLLGRAAWLWLETKDMAGLKRNLRQICISLLLALMPILGWCAHNLNRYGFFGITDYMGAALYDGWVYFGERSHVDIIDKNSPSVQVILNQFPEELNNAHRSPTSWAVYDKLKKLDYTDKEIFSILQQAALDSLQKDPALTTKLLFIKIREGFTPETAATITFPLPEEKQDAPPPDEADYFQEEGISFPFLIKLLRKVYVVQESWYRNGYSPLVWFCVVFSLFCFYRKPFHLWISYAILILSRVFFPTIFALSHWRYVVSGIVPLLILFPFAIQSLVDFIGFLIQPSLVERGD